ncbi:MAG TPA: nucleotide pyrophosphatase/phosphodiesterase family protein [Methylomirabilota bacterium]|nr:nucleotide pyrophosphatase/phosphodiesterase family protein [Methylomirabilota bacterium]
MRRTAIIDVVGLTTGCLGPETPRLNAFLKRSALARINPGLPAVTCTAQSTYLTGVSPAQHGIVGNGWYNRELSEVQFWKQSNRLVGAPKLWEELRAQEPKFTCAKLFWWYNMYSSADWSITPRPAYPADGRKVFDIYTHPADIRYEIKKELGEFPFPAFWGPAAGSDSPKFKADDVSRWIAASAKWIEERHHPTLSLIYLPHLDYNLQRFGPNDPRVGKDYAEIDLIVGDLIDYFDKAGVQVVLLSEYGITEVNQPVHLNRIFREQGWIKVREELGLEILDAGASDVFAVADHQLAHIYINNASIAPRLKALLQKTPGVGEILDGPGKSREGLNHPRSGDLVVISTPEAWFTYYYWLDDALAPDFARTVDIHRKPGYDPVELFIDPTLKAPKLKIAASLLKKKLGFRMLMDVIPLDATLVKGSHGRRPERVEDWPVLIAPGLQAEGGAVAATDVCRLLKQLILR